jgi:hypothetical protein
VRTTNRILSALLGLALLVVGLAVVIEMVLIALGREPIVVPLDRWYESLRTVRLADRGFLAAAAVAALIGLVLVILELRPWAPQRVRTDVSLGTPLWINRRSVERRVDSASATAGVEHPHSRVRGKPGRWRLRLYGAAWPDQLDSVATAVRAELDRLHAPPDIAVSLALRRPSRRVR